MKVLIDDGMQIAVGTGIGKYSYYLYKAMKNIGIDVHLYNYKPKSKKRNISRIEYLKHINSKAFVNFTKQFDIVIFTNYTIPFRTNKYTVYAATIPDMVAYLHPTTLPLFYRLYNQLSIKNSVKKADIIFTISNTVKNEIISKFPRYKEKIEYTWLGVYDEIGLKIKKTEYENSLLRGIKSHNFFLLISTVEKRKNVGLAIEAFIKLKEKHTNASSYKFVIVGRPGYGYNDFINTANSSSYGKDIIFAGYASDSDCNLLYNQAKSFIFPTIYEGFGFAQIECMKCHLPIILSSIPTNLEISRDYGLFFDINKIESLIEKMRVIIDNEYDYNSHNILAEKYLKSFDWDTIATKYYDILQNKYLSLKTQKGIKK